MFGIGMQIGAIQLYCAKSARHNARHNAGLGDHLVRHVPFSQRTRPLVQDKLLPLLLSCTPARFYNRSMTLESLLLSQDPELVRVVRPTLEKLAIDVEICHEARAATEILISDKFDAIIIDCDDMVGGLEVLQGLRNTPSNRNSVTFAILNGKKTTTQDAFTMGANFVLQKPISSLNASRCFNAAVNFMIKERRRYFRQPVQMDVRAILGDKQWKATSTNISEGGMALMVREALPKGA